MERIRECKWVRRGEGGGEKNFSVYTFIFRISNTLQTEPINNLKLDMQEE